MSEQIGKKVWAIPGGNIPLEQTGDEPDFTSHDSLWMLNTTDEDAQVEITIYYADREPIGPYPIEVEARRVRQVRFNDLIDPEAMPLETDYGAVVEASVPIVVQFTTMDTRQAANTRSISLGY
jgi:hypothetical protein